LIKLFGDIIKGLSMVEIKIIKSCCINTTRKYSSLIVILASLFLTSCGFLGNKEDKAKNSEISKQKDWEPNVLKRVDDNKGQGVIIFGGGKKESASGGDNVIWQASLDVLADIPLAQANYAGGVIITDWYNSSNSNESIKISIFINSARLETNSFDVKSFKKTCTTANSCQTVNLASDFNQKIKDKVLEKARVISVKKETNKK
jgi:hypothetical protein